MLIKMNLNDAQVEKLERLKQVSQENTGSKAAIYALDNFTQLQYDYNHLSLEYDDLKQQLEQIKDAVQQKLIAEVSLLKLLDDEPIA